MKAGAPLTGRRLRCGAHERSGTACGLSHAARCLTFSLRWHYPDQVTGSVSRPDTLSAGCPSSPGLLFGCRSRSL